MTQPRPSKMMASQREFGDGRTMVRGEGAGPSPTGDIAVADVSTTANISLSGLQMIDGVALAVGDKVLVKNQSTASENGVYSVASAAWSKTSQPKVVHVVEGTQNGRLCYYLTAANTYSANRGVFK